jgi:catechol 2,3-dioxygenase-like lactoylglutathione lyase family enzyme
VPDLEQAVDFFTRVLGCDLLYRTGPAFDPTGGDWMQSHYGIDAGATLRTAMLRCGPGSNLELLAWSSTDPPSIAGAATGMGAGHLGMYVDDVSAAAAYLAAQPGVRVLGPPSILSEEPNEGTEFVYAFLPWGMSLELVKWPPLMPYCATTPARLLAPASRWRP